MIDYIKIHVPIDPNLWLENPLLDFKAEVNVNTGELGGKRFARYNGMTFSIIKKNDDMYLCELRGSLHYYFNNSAHNVNDFTYHDVKNVFRELEQKFNVVQESTIINFEFGVNVFIKGGESVDKFLGGLIAEVSENNYITPFVAMASSSLKIGKVVQHDNYKLKIYDKGKQSDLEHRNLLRVEIKIRRKRYLDNHNLKEPSSIFTIQDLLKYSSFVILSELLLGEYNRIMFSDPRMIDIRNFSEKNQKKFILFHLSKYWNKLNNCQRQRQYTQFRKLIRECSSDKMKNDVGLSIEEKLNYLINAKGSNCVALKNELFTSNDEASDVLLAKRVHLNKSSVVPERICLVCGSSLSNKKDNALYCSKKCSNVVASNNRKLRHDEMIMHECSDLKFLLSILSKGECFDFNYLNKGMMRRIKISRNDYKSFRMSYKKYRKIVRVEVNYKGRDYVLTAMRAKKFIKSIILYHSS